MSLDVNRIIKESLSKESKETITESIEGGIAALKRSSEATKSIFSGGSATDEASASREFAKLAREKAVKEGLPVEEFLGKNVVRVDSPAGQIKSAIKDIPSEKGTTEEKQAAAETIGKKALDAVKEHPGIAAATVAALAAGAGALLLRRRLKKKS